MADRPDERPQRLVPTAVAAFKAARKIAWGAKAVWVEDWILDRGPEASWISATNLAARLGMSKDNVEQHRRHLLSLGFYHVVRRIGARSDGWVPTLPLGCRHHGTTVEAILATAARIDALVTGTTRAIEDGAGGSGARGVSQPAASGAPHYAMKGAAGYATRRPLIQHQPEGQTLASSEDRTREGAHAPKAEKDGRLAAERSTPDSEEILTEEQRWERLRQRHAERRRQAGLA